MKNSVKYFAVLIAVIANLSDIQAQNDSYFKGGNLYILNSSHQDIAWMDAPEVCIRFRDENMITPALKRMAESKDFCFDVEDALSLREYLERHPDRYNDILKYTLEGRLSWGATNKQPYQSMYDGEALIRQVYFGRKWLKKTLPGCDFRTAWNEDVPGMALQFPQILAKAGIPYYQFSRHQPGFYKWFSPDGSFVLGWTVGQYDESGIPIRKAAADEDKRTDAFADILSQWAPYYKQRGISPSYIFLFSFDFSEPLNWDKYIADWNGKVAGANEKKLPYIHYATSTMALDELSKHQTKFDELHGERPNVWLYIHGPAHQRALKAGRDASRLLTAAEKFATFDALLKNSFANYPARSLSDAWESAIYPDHGWGGNKGDITDRMFRGKFEFARDKGKELLNESLTSIAHQIKFNKEHQRAVTVFNPLSWERTDPVTFTLDVEGWQNTHFKLIDESGKEIACQLTGQHQYTGNRDEVISVVFVAENVPAMGYKTYYLTDGTQPAGNFQIPTTVPAYENKYYKVVLGNGGIESLYDKELKSEFFQTKKFSGGELFTMQSKGNGAGEFTDVQQPTMEGFDQLRNYKQQWQCIETGAVRDVFQTIQPLKETQACLRIVLYKTVKRIDVEVDLNRFNGENWREFRLAFPVNMKQAKVAYEVPMGVVEVGKDEIAGAAGFSKASQIYSTPCKDVHPREVQDWFSASDGKTGLTISSDVAVFDWIDPTDKPVDYPVLQPVLLASRKSCHWLGNYYLQAGDHSYSFSLFTHSGNWQNGYRQGTQSKQPLQVVVSIPQNYSGTLPAQYSFGSVTGKGVVVSTVKKCDDDDSVVLRCYDIEGKDTEATFRLSGKVEAVSHTNIIEEEPVAVQSSENGFSAKIGHHAIETFKLKMH
ncbi:MAG: glycosyl hydrolase-related protein [Bacteroidales bacterium]|jgi:alpha-mannosidase|nr:glycosyl hydrolase-related protein [Bacteroidales bacterium]